LHLSLWHLLIITINEIGGEQMIREIEELMSNKSSFARYRQILTLSNPPCIPYLYEPHYLVKDVFLD